MTLIDEHRLRTPPLDATRTLSLPTSPPYRPEPNHVPAPTVVHDEPDRRSRVRIALQLALAVTAFVAFGIFCVTPDGTGFVQRLDSRLLALIHVEGWRSTNLVHAVTSPPVAILLSLVVCVIGFVRGHRWFQQVRPMVLTAAAAATAWVPATLVRRPSPGHLGDLTAANATSFPSITAAMLTMLTCLSIADAARRGRPRLWRTVPLAMTVLVVGAKLVTASSWPLDELAGIVVGLLTFRLLASGRAARRTRHVRTAQQRRGRLATFALVLLCVVVPVGSSFAGGMRASGNAALDQRFVEWLRDNGLSSLVDRGESWWLWRHLPSPTATIAELPAPPVTVAIDAAGDALLPANVTPRIWPALPNEGTWNVAATDTAGRPQIATTTFRPDPGHPSLVASVAWMSGSRTSFGLVAGTKQPGNGVGPSGGKVPASSIDSLLAAFNSGYKMKDTPGGTLIEGRTTRSMVDGLATFAIRADGSATIGEWGREISAADGYVGLRQNLHLMVRNGALVDGVQTNAGGRWGTVRNTLPTWRSGLGVTATGDVVYVAGNNLTLGVLADALVRAGAVTAMELDIHRSMVVYNMFTHGPTLTGHKLIADSKGSADRYLRTDWRDFVVVTAR